LELTLLEICAQNQENSISGDLKCKNFLGAYADAPRRYRLQGLIITIRLLRNFCQLLEKLWTTLLLCIHSVRLGYGPRYSRFLGNLPTNTKVIVRGL